MHEPCGVMIMLGAVSPTSAVPARGMATAPLGELVVMVTDPVKEPATEGSNTTLMEQLAKAARDPVELPLGIQVLVWVNADPDSVMELIVTGVPVPLVTVTFCGLLGLPRSCGPKATFCGFTFSVATVSFPVSVAVCGLFAASSVTDNVADWALAVGGAN